MWVGSHGPGEAMGMRRGVMSSFSPRKWSLLEVTNHARDLSVKMDHFFFFSAPTPKEGRRSFLFFCQGRDIGRLVEGLYRALSMVVG